MKAFLFILLLTFLYIALVNLVYSSMNLWPRSSSSLSLAPSSESGEGKTKGFARNKFMGKNSKESVEDVFLIGVKTIKKAVKECVWGGGGPRMDLDTVTLPPCPKRTYFHTCLFVCLFVGLV